MYRRLAISCVILFLKKNLNAFQVRIFAKIGIFLNLYKIILPLIAVTLCVSCKHGEQKGSAIDSFSAGSGEQVAIKSYSFNDLSPLLHQDDDTLRIVNFWATWCKPCVEELPAFEQVALEYRGKKVKILYVSLDFPEQVEEKVVPFIRKKKMQNVLLLNDPKSNTWIPKINQSWSGAIPATLLYRNGKRNFYEKGFNYSSLKEAISEYDM